MSELRFDEKTLLLFDMDGTVMPLLADPKRRRIDPKALEAFNLFQEARPNHVVAATGRDYQQVIDAFGGDHPFFPVIMNDGADLLLPSGQLYSYNFSPKELEFISYAKQQMARFSAKHPELITEIKDWSIGFHCVAKHGFGRGEISCDDLADMVSQSSHVASNMLDDLVAQARQEGLKFCRGGADATHSDFRHALVNKADSIGWFSSYLPSLPTSNDWSHVVFCCDSLHGGGNDREIAKMVREKNGKIILVTNGLECRMPREGSSAEPHFAVETPEELGQVLLHHTRQMLVRMKSPLALKF